MSDRSIASAHLELPEEVQEAVARAWLTRLADADRLGGLDDEALMKAMEKLSDFGRIVGNGCSFATVELTDRSRRELGEKGLARSRGYKTPEDLIAVVTGTPAAETRRRVWEAGPLQPVRSAFTGRLQDVPFPLLRAAVAAGLLSGGVSAMATGPLAPLRDRGDAREQQVLRRQVARAELDLVVLAVGTQAVLDHAEVFDRVELPAGVLAAVAAELAGARVSGAFGASGAGEGGKALEGMTTSAVLLRIARLVGASRRPACHERLRRSANAHKNAILAGVAKASRSEGERRRAERQRSEEQRFVRLAQRPDGLWDLRGVLVADIAAQLMLLRDAVLNPKRNRPGPAGAGGGADSGEGNSAVAGADAGDWAGAGAGCGVRPGAEGRPWGSDGRTLPTDEQGRLVVIEDPRSGGQRFHDALASILTMTANAAQAGTLQGANPTLVVTCSVDQIGDANGFAFLQGTHEEATSVVDASVARHAGCAGSIERIVHDREGRPIQMTSVGRIFTRAQREAIALRDGGCSWPGCTVPASWVEIHHVVEWSKGGATTVDSGCSLCFRHHRDLETLGWEIQMRGGVPWFRPPPSVDPDRGWIRGQQSAHMLFDQVRQRWTDVAPSLLGEDEGREPPATGTDGRSVPARGTGTETASGVAPGIGVGMTATCGGAPACGPGPVADGTSVPAPGRPLGGAQDPWAGAPGWARHRPAPPRRSDAPGRSGTVVGDIDALFAL